MKTTTRPINDTMVVSYDRPKPSDIPMYYMSDIKGDLGVSNVHSLSVV